MKTVKVKDKLISESYEIDAKMKKNRYFTFRDYLVYTDKNKMISLFVGDLISQVCPLIERKHD